MVWISTEESLRNREVSFLAIIETILAVVIYWGIAVYFDTYLHILFSVFLTPLLLLQSHESMKMGLELFNKRMSSKYEDNSLEMQGTLSVLMLIYGFFFFIIGKFFFNYSFIDIIPYLFLLGFTHIVIKIYYAIGYSTYSIFKNFKFGYRNFMSNWYYNNLSIDFKQPPEIISKIENYDGLDDYKISYMLNHLMKRGFINAIYVLIVLWLIYPFTIFYRLSIKSTFWFYIPLLFVVQKPNLDTSKNIGKFLSELYQTVWAWVRAILAVITVGTFFITYFDYYSFSNLNFPFSSIIFLLYLNFSSIEIWKIFQLLVALLTIGLFFYANAIRVPNVSNNIPLQNDGHVKTIFYLNSIRNWLSLFYLLSAFIFLAVHLKIWEYSYVPNFLYSFFITLLEYVQYVPFR